MSETDNAVARAIAAETEAQENIDAAQAESQDAAVSLGLLREAINKEREGLDKMEEGLEQIERALEDRRQGLDQQEELLSRLIRD